VTFPVPWGERSVSRDLQCDLARVLVVGDVLQAGPWSSHLGLGLGFTRVELDPQDFSSSVTQEKSLLGAAASAGLHYQFRRWMEVVTEISAFHSFEELHVVDIESRDLFSTTRKENVFPIQIWSAQIAARFRIP